MKSKKKQWQFMDAKFYVASVTQPLIDIPIVSSLLQDPVNDFKNETINGGLLGNTIAG